MKHGVRPSPALDSRGMDVMPSRPKVFMLSDADPKLVHSGPALVGPDGSRHEVPPKVYEAMQFVEAALAKGLAVQITPLRHELPIDEAAGAIAMPRRDLRSYVAGGEIPFRSSEYVDWVRLADVLALSQRVKAQRRVALDEMLSEPLWEDGDDAGSAADSDR
jgi:hypothetical protein